MVISREKLEQQRKIRLLRESREQLTLQKAKEESQLTKPAVDLGTTENPVPTRELTEECGSSKAIKETDFDQVTEQFYDRTDLLNWLDDLVDEWGVEPKFEEVWAVMQKEPRKFQGFVGNMGLPLLKRLVNDEIDIKAQEQQTDRSGAWADHNDETFFEEQEKPWEKSKERRDEHQKEIEKRAIRETSLSASDSSSINLLLGCIADLAGAREKLKKLLANTAQDFDELDLDILSDIDVNMGKDTRDLMKLAQQVKSKVVAESKKTKKTNLDTLLEACSVEGEIK